MGQERRHEMHNELHCKNIMCFNNSGTLLKISFLPAHKPIKNKPIYSGIPISSCWGSSIIRKANVLLLDINNV